MDTNELPEGTLGQDAQPVEHKVERLIEVDLEGYFVCDFINFQDATTEFPARWTRDITPNGMYKAKYVGFALKDDGEMTHGTWVDTQAPDAETVAIQERQRLEVLINQERDRRISGGFSFQGHEYQSGDSDRENMAGAAQLAFMAVVMQGAQAGDVNWSSKVKPFGYITSDNSIVEMDAPTVIDLGRAAATHKEVHIFAARELKNMETLPEDYQDDKYWPSKEVTL